MHFPYVIANDTAHTKEEIDQVRALIAAKEHEEIQSAASVSSTTHPDPGLQYHLSPNVETTMNESLIAATLAKLATDTETFAETEYIVSADRDRTQARIGPDRDGLDMVRFLITWRSNTVYEDSVEVLSEDSCVELDRAQAVAAALHMIACALGEVAALDAERAIAPHMKASKP